MTSLTGGNAAANDIRKLMEQIIAERDAKFAPKQEGGEAAPTGGMFDKPEVKADEGDVITDLLGYLEQKRTEALDSYQSKVMRRSTKPLPKPEDIDVSSFLSEAGLSSQPEPLTFTSDTAPALGEPSWSQVADNVFLDPSKEPAKPKLSEGLLSREDKPVEELTDDEKFLRTGKLPKEGLMSPPATDDDMGLPITASDDEVDISFNNIFKLIEKGEGGYEASNRGTKNKKIVGSDLSTTRDGKKLTEMTLGEIKAYQALTNPSDENRLFAVGRFQMIPAVLKEAQEAYGLADDTIFNADAQNLLGRYLITKKRPKLGQYFAGSDQVSTETAMIELAREFASFPVPKDLRIRDGEDENGQPKYRNVKKGQSYYGGANKSHHSIDTVKDMLASAIGTIVNKPTAVATSPRPKARD